MLPTRTVLWLPVLLFLFGLNGCSTFDRDWELKTPASADMADPISGRWQGTWLSAGNGHTGGLRCLLSREEDGTYVARYHATYSCCFNFEYSVPMAVEKDGENFKFRGEADLGWLAGGAYTYQGLISGIDFHSDYRSSADHGTFKMTRVP